jgi:Tfp pilus assembly protein FimT
MITLAVLAVLVALAAPSMSDTLDRRRLIGAAEAVYSQLQFARSEAIKQSRDMQVSYSEVAPWCAGIRDDAADCDCTETDPDDAEACSILGDGTTRVLKVVTTADFPGIDLDSNSDSFEFNNVRGTADASGTVTLTSAESGRELKVAVSILGRVRMCSPSGSTNVAGYPTSCP